MCNDRPRLYVCQAETDASSFIVTHVRTGDIAGITISALVTNTGTRPGTKVLMAFATVNTLEAEDSTSPRGVNSQLQTQLQSPLQSLWFQHKVALTPGETARVDIRVAQDEWCPFCTVNAVGIRAVRPGIYTLRIGGHGGSGGCDGEEGACFMARYALHGQVMERPL